MLQQHREGWATEVQTGRTFKKEGKNEAMIISLKLSFFHLLKHHYLYSLWGSPRIISFILPASPGRKQTVTCSSVCTRQPASSKFGKLYAAEPADAVCSFPSCLFTPVLHPTVSAFIWHRLSKKAGGDVGIVGRKDESKDSRGGGNIDAGIRSVLPQCAHSTHIHMLREWYAAAREPKFWAWQDVW